MHDDIRKFSLEGSLTDGNISSNKDRLVHYVENLMRDFGHVPSLDNEPQFTLEYDQEEQSFKFSLTVYGVKVGKEKSWQIDGVSGGKKIPFTQKDK